MKIKNGDTVRITSGKDKGMTGKVTQVLPALHAVVVDGVNKTVKHLRKRGTMQGQKIEFFAPVNVSNVRVVGAKQEGRVGYKHLEKGGKTTKVRVVKKARVQEDLE